MTCVLAWRERMTDVAAALDDHPAVIAPGTLAPETDPTNCWTLEFLLDAGYHAIPSDVLTLLGGYELGIREAVLQHPYRHVVAIARD